jgi:hypothetical protein
MPLGLDDLATIRLQPTHHYLQLRRLAGTIHTCDEQTHKASLSTL